MMRTFFLALSLLYVVTAHAKDESTSIPSALKSVIVYRSGAQLTHTASATLKRGDNELIIENISNNIDVNSIQVKAPAAVTVLGVEFSGNYLPAVEKSAREKTLEDSLDHVQQDIDKALLAITNINDLFGVLKENRNIKGEQTGMSVTELTKLMDYYKTKSLELQTEMQQLNNRKKKLYDVADKIKAQIAEEQKKNVSTAGRVTLRLSAAMDARADFTISYIAKNAYWTPFYDVRADNINSPLKLSYKAKIIQTTGIDWKQVKMSLSTSMPAQSNNAPALGTWFLGYINPHKGLGNALKGKLAGVSVLNDLVVAGYGVRKDEVSDNYEEKKELKPVYIVNGEVMDEAAFNDIDPNAIKSMKVLKSNESSNLYGSRAAGGAVVVGLKSGLQDYTKLVDSTLNVMFDIELAYNVPTNGKEQVATLQEFNMSGTFHHLAIPKMDNSVYLLSEITGFEKYNLLPGEADIIFENTYIGKTYINPAALNDTLSLTMGRDDRVTIKRDKLKDFSSVKFLGSNKLQKFTYEITVRNNKSETVNMLLKDQYPLSTNKDIEVELLNSNNAEVNTETGALAWKLTLAPGESKKVRFEYSIKYPKDKALNLN